MRARWRWHPLARMQTSLLTPLDDLDIMHGIATQAAAREPLYASELSPALGWQGTRYRQ